MWVCGDGGGIQMSVEGLGAASTPEQLNLLRTSCLLLSSGLLKQHRPHLPALERLPGAGTTQWERAQQLRALLVISQVSYFFFLQVCEPCCGPPFLSFLV